MNGALIGMKCMTKKAGQIRQVPIRDVFECSVEVAGAVTESTDVYRHERTLFQTEDFMFLVGAIRVNTICE